VAHDYPFGIEEEYFLTSQSSGKLATRAPAKLLKAAKQKLGKLVTSELLQSQIEIASPIFRSNDEAAEILPRLRRDLAEVADAYGLALVAAGTHPLGAWREQLVTDKPRYGELMSDFRIIGERNLVCGMHIHVEVPPGIDRVVLMNRLMPWLPLFLAFSASSPFWHGHPTGLLSYRQAVYDEWPRSGIPDFFADEADYRAFVDLMTLTGALKNSSYLWWAIRPSHKFPTLELRIADVCTRAQDGIALAALFRALVATFVAHPHLGTERTTHTRRLIEENRWLAKRDGTGALFIDEKERRALPISEVLQRSFDLVGEEAARLGCLPSLERLQTIEREGTSAHEQLRIFHQLRADGLSRAVALKSVVDWLIVTTRGVG
jgi:carboxylate-amine ligase